MTELDRDPPMQTPPEPEAAGMHSAVNKALRWSYYLMFWYLPYRQLGPAARRFIRVLHVAAFSGVALVLVCADRVVGAGLALLAAVLVHASLRLVDHDVEGGAAVPRTRWNLPADLEAASTAAPLRSMSELTPKPKNSATCGPGRDAGHGGPRR